MDSWDVPEMRMKEELWWAPYVRDFRQLSPLKDPIAAINRRTPGDAPLIQTAVAYRTMCVNVPQYLLYLQAQAKILAVDVVKARLPVEMGLEHSLRAAGGLLGGIEVDCLSLIHI